MAQHNMGATMSHVNATGTSSSFPTGGPLKVERSTNDEAMRASGGPVRFPNRNTGEARRHNKMVGSMHKEVSGIGRGAYLEEQMETGEGYAPNRPITKDMTMSDKGPGSFYRNVIPVTEDVIDDPEFRSTYLEKGAYAISARTDRSEHSFAKATDHPRWDPKSTKGTAVEVRRHNIAVKHLASGHVGKAAKGHMFTKSPPNRRTRLDFHATPDRQRLMESGSYGSSDVTHKIHEARKAFRREMRRESDGKMCLVSGKHSAEALTFESSGYPDHDAAFLGGATGPRSKRVGLGVVAPSTGPEPRAALGRALQSSGVVGAWSKPEEWAITSPLQPSGRRDRYLGTTAASCAKESDGADPVVRAPLRMTRPHTVADLSSKSSGQIGQFWVQDDRGSWWKGEAALGEGLGVGGIPHWQAYPELHTHAPGDETARKTAAAHRDLLTSGIAGSHVSARGPRSSQAVDFNEPKGCLLKPSEHENAKFKPPMGEATDGMPLALKPNAPRASPGKIHEWRQLASAPRHGGGGALEAANKKTDAFHRSAKTSLIAAAASHARATTPLVGVSGTRTARERSRKAIVERTTAADYDIGWSHVLRGQKW
mmetsp:Transcript_63436/g.143089  ORF Transcript_63436/g.143089 Transcript_63436/m.143089 type:complete len:596 (+) Transcript_63436:29-1816(+)